MKIGSEAFSKNVGSNSRDIVSFGIAVSVAIDLDSRGARHCCNSISTLFLESQSRNIPLRDLSNSKHISAKFSNSSRGSAILSTPLLWFDGRGVQFEEV